MQLSMPVQQLIATRHPCMPDALPQHEAPPCSPVAAVGWNSHREVQHGPRDTQQQTEGAASTVPAPSCPRPAEVAQQACSTVQAANRSPNSSGKGEHTKGETGWAKDAGEVLQLRPTAFTNPAWLPQSVVMQVEKHLRGPKPSRHFNGPQPEGRGKAGDAPGKLSSSPLVRMLL